jgi:hypothetical protein
MSVSISVMSNIPLRLMTLDSILVMIFCKHIQSQRTEYINTLFYADEFENFSLPPSTLKIIDDTAIGCAAREGYLPVRRYQPPSSAL